MIAAAEAVATMRMHLAEDVKRRCLIKRRRAFGGFLGWFKSYFPHYITRPYSFMHRDFSGTIHHLHTHRGIKVLRLAHRSSSKSSFFTAPGFPLFSVCMGTEQYIIICADTAPQSRKYLSSIKAELETNEKLMEDYPHVCGKGPVWTQNTIVTRNGVTIEALGAGNSIRGRRAGQHRPTLIIIDDPENDKSKYSSTVRQHKREWFMNGVMKAGDADTNFVVIGTPLHRECLVSHLYDSPGWNKKEFKAVYKWPVRMDLWDEWENIYSSLSKDAEALADEFYKQNKEALHEGAIVIWPELYSLLDLMKIRAEGHASFEQEMQCNPIDPSLCEWPEGSFDGDELWFDDWPEDIAVRAVALDPSKGKSDKRGDYQAIVDVGISAERNDIYVDCDMRRRPVRQLVEDFVRYTADARPDVACVEANQFQECIVGECEDFAIRESLVVPIVPLYNGNTPKAARIRRLSPYISRRRLRFRRRSPGARLLVEQLATWPTGDHDDGPDALEMALRKAAELMQGGNADVVEDPI